MISVISPVSFESGIKDFDNLLNQSPELKLLFNAININRTADSTKEKSGHPAIIPSALEVMLFADVDDQMSYAVKSYVELDSGRMQVSDFIVKQVWEEQNGQNIMNLVSDEGEILTRLDGATKYMLALVADNYRIQHFVKADGEQ